MDLLQKLQKEYAKPYDDLGISKSFGEVFTLLEGVIHFDLQGTYAGLGETVLPQMQKAFDADSLGSVAVLKLLAGDLENLMKKVIEMTERNLDKVATDQQGKLYLKELSGHLRIEQCKPVQKTTRYIRNEQTHNAEQLPLRAYYEDLEDVVLAYFVAVHSRYALLFAKVFSERDFTPYLKTVIEDYDLQQAVFVDLDVKEYIVIEGKEVQARGNLKPARRGTIEQLRNTIPENQMMLLGAAGMGKTTSLLFLAKKAAEKILGSKSDSAPIPVYITLAAFTDAADTIEGKIAQRLKKSKILTSEYLNNGKISLFLDGYNEVLPNLVEAIRRKIQAFIEHYPKVKLTIASRPIAYEDIEFKEAGNQPLQHRKPIPAFILQEMKADLITQFITKNYKGNAQELLDEINNFEGLGDILKTPLHLAEFIAIYEKGSTMPRSTTEITGVFMEKKYKREKDQDATFDKNAFASIIATYTLHISVEISEANPHVAFKDAKKIIAKIIKDLNVRMSADDFLKRARSTNIMVKDREDDCYFAHQSYQDLFYQQADEDF